MKAIAITMMFLLALVTINIANKWKNIVEANDYKKYQRTSHGMFKVTMVLLDIDDRRARGMKKGQELMGQQFKGAVVGRFISYEAATFDDEGIGGPATVRAELMADVTKQGGVVLWETKPVVVGRKISLLSPDGCCFLKGGVIREVEFSDEDTPLVPYRLSKLGEEK